MKRALRSEIFRARKRTMSIVLLVILPGVVILIYALYLFLVRGGDADLDETTLADLRDGLRLNEVRGFGLLQVQYYGAVLLVIFAATLVASEFSWGTIRTVVPRSERRGDILGAKFIVIAAFTVILVVVGYVAAIPSALAVSAIEGLDMSVEGNFPVESLLAIGRTSFVLLPYAAIAAFVALWTKSSGAAIGVGLAVVFLEPVIMMIIATAGDIGAQVPAMLISRNVAAVLALNSPGSITRDQFGAEVEDVPGAWQAAGVLSLYLAVFVSLTYWRFRTRDITSG